MKNLCLILCLLAILATSSSFAKSTETTAADISFSQIQFCTTCDLLDEKESPNLELEDFTPGETKAHNEWDQMLQEAMATNSSDTN